MEPSNTNSGPIPNVRIAQNFLLIWLDECINKNNKDDYHNSITKFRQVVNTVNRFTDRNECIDYVTNIEHEKVFMVVSGTFSQTIVPIIQAIPQVSSIYIFGENKDEDKQWTEQWSKVKGIFTNVTPICEALKKDAQHCDQNMVTINFLKSFNDETSKQNLDQLDQSFMYTQMLKEILLTIDFKKEHIDEFLMYCREQLVHDIVALQNVDRFEKEYRHHDPIWWYTCSSFLYPMLNRALRMTEVDLIIKMGFFVKDLHNHIVKLHSKQYSGQDRTNSITVYRGQGLSPTDFEQLMKTKGGLLSFNNFLSTSLDRAVSYVFAESNQYNPDTIGVLFEITINPSVSSTSFSSIRDVSAFETEEEILFSMHSVFRIGQVQQLDGNNRLWQVKLILTSDNDPQLHDLAKYMSDQIIGSTGWVRLSHLMLLLGQFNKAEDLYDILLKQTTDEDKKVHLYHMLGCSKNGQEKYAEAIEFYEKALEIWKKTLPPNHSDLATSYNNIGVMYAKMNEYSKAISFHEKALEIRQKTLPPNHLELATSYNNIGWVYEKMDECSKALSYIEKALKIWKNILPSNHPDLAISYNNIGFVYEKMGEYSKAHSHYEKAFEIQQKTLPPNHLELATSYNNIGKMYNSRREYSKALLYCEKALEIRQKTQPPNHPDVAISYNNIGFVYYNMGEYSKAHSHYEKAFEIQQKTLPPNHPDLATSYNNIGTMYNSMREYSKALLYCEKALEIRQKTLPPNHPDLIISYSNIGLMYDNIGEYAKALSSREKALEIQQKTLPSNDPTLANSYNNIGTMYNSRREYSKALLYCEKAFEIWKNILPPNHPDLVSCYNNIGALYHNMGKHSKALSYLERAIDIGQRSLPANHPTLLHLQKTIEYLKRAM